MKEGDNKMSSLEFTKKHITPERANAIYHCITSAVHSYWTKYSDLRIQHTLRTDSSIIHDWIVANIKAEFHNWPGAHCCTVNNLFLLGFDNGAVYMRFKKMDKRMRVHNIPTQQSFQFANQLTFFEPSVNLNAGYLIKGLDVKVFLACPESTRSNNWVWELEADKSTLAPVIDIQVPNTTTRRVSAKGKEQEKYEYQE